MDTRTELETSSSQPGPRWADVFFEPTPIGGLVEVVDGTWLATWLGDEMDGITDRNLRLLVGFGPVVDLVPMAPLEICVVFRWLSPAWVDDLGNGSFGQLSRIDIDTISLAAHAA